MQKVISINEFEKTLNSIDDIEEPIIIKRENKEDLVVISLAEYKKSLFLTELSSKLAESEEQYKNCLLYTSKCLDSRIYATIYKAKTTYTN